MKTNSATTPSPVSREPRLILSHEEAVEEDRRIHAVPVVEPRPSEPLLMLNALKAVKKLFSDDSKFYIKKLGSPITNRDQAEIDAVFIAIDQAITANERLGERGCCQYCGADRSGPSAEAHSNDCPAAAPPQVPSPEPTAICPECRAKSQLTLTATGPWIHITCGACGQWWSIGEIEHTPYFFGGKVASNGPNKVATCSVEGCTNPSRWQSKCEYHLNEKTARSEVSREPISAEQAIFAPEELVSVWKSTAYGILGTDERTVWNVKMFGDMVLAGIFSSSDAANEFAGRLRRTLEAYARAAARTCETKEK